MECDANMSFKKDVCELNCEGKKMDPLCEEGDATSCTVGCQCNEGFRRHNGKCVSLAECSTLSACKVRGRKAPVPVSNLKKFILQE